MSAPPQRSPPSGGRAEFQQWDTIPKDDKATYITVATGDDRNLPLLRPDSSWDTYKLDPHAQSYDAAWPWDDITDPSIREQIQARYTPYNAL